MQRRSPARKKWVGQRPSSNGPTNRISQTHLVENVLQALLRQSRALNVLDGAQLAGQLLALLSHNRPLLRPRELLHDAGIVAQIDLGSNDQAGHAGAVVVNFREPFFFDVFKRRWSGDAEAHEENIRLGVRERTQTIVILLTWKRTGVWVSDVGGGEESHTQVGTRGIRETQQRTQRRLRSTLQHTTEKKDTAADSPAVSKRPRVYGSSPIITVTA